MRSLAAALSGTRVGRRRRGRLILCLPLLLAALLPARGHLPDPVAGAIEAAGAAFRAASFSAAAELLTPWAGVDDRAARELLALRFLVGDLKGVLAQAEARPQALDRSAGLWAARAAAGLGDWRACLAYLDALPQTDLAWALSLRAEALQALGDPGAGAALELALSATAGTRLAACTALMGGGAAEARGDTRLAESLYKRAEAADPSYTMVHARLARLYRAAGRVRDARIRLERGLAVDPGNRALRVELNALLASAPGEADALRRSQALAEARFLARGNPRVVPQTPLPGEPTIRVGLLENAPRFTLSLGGAMAVSPGSRSLAAGSVWRVQSLSGRAWELLPLSPSAGEALRFSSVLRLEPLDAASTFGLHDVDHGTGYWWAGKEDRYYRGSAELRPQAAGGITLVNELGLEAYLLSVVPSEMPATWPLESLKAQAVAARSDAWVSRGRFAAKGYDLCPTQLCAVYAGVTAEHPRSSAAVTATAGLLLAEASGRVVPTFYMHNSGGHTQDPDEAWGAFKSGPTGWATPDAPADSPLRALFPVTPASLLRFIDDLDSAPAWPRESSTWRWTLRLSAGELEALVARRHPGVPPLRAVLPQERTQGGYVRRVIFRGRTDSVGSSDYIRSAIRGLRSNLFVVEPRLGPDGAPTDFLFHGGGWGHGVGMSQAGARAMALAGLDATAILKHYFGSERLVRRY